MADQRVAGIVIPLTAEQKEMIKRISGADASEVVFVAQTSAGQRLQGELTSAADQELARMLWLTNQEFNNELSKKPDVLQAWSNPGNRQGPPAVAFLR